jgi:hypothetical protein
MSRMTSVWYLPAGAIAGVVAGIIIGGYVCQPWTMDGGLFGLVVGAAASSWRRSGDFELVRQIVLFGLLGLALCAMSFGNAFVSFCSSIALGILSAWIVAGVIRPAGNG